jgi:hypothetical protein
MGKLYKELRRGEFAKAFIKIVFDTNIYIRLNSWECEMDVPGSG